VSLAHQIQRVAPRKEIAPPVGVKWHPYCEIFPWIEGPAYRELVEDIRKNGVLEPIVFIGEQILDGRNRYMAAREIGIEYPRVEYEGDDPLSFVISKNLARRHLNDRQRADAAAKIAKLPRGANQHTPIGGPSLSQAAKMLDVSVKAVERAKAVQEHAVPELKERYESGEIAPSVAAEAAALPVEQQIKALAESDPKAFKRVVKEARAVVHAEKKAKRADREVKLAGKIMALPDRKYGVIVADPEWEDENWSEETGSDRAASNHYPVSSADIIASRAVPTIAADDCVLWLWTTNQHLRIAIDVMEAWGFVYASNYVWGKPSIGLGRWNRSKHEILLVGTKGKPVAPAPGTQRESLLQAPVPGGHSSKPDVFLEMIEGYYPNVPKIELNRRGPARPAWDAWGLESEIAHSSAPSSSPVSTDTTGASAEVPVTNSRAA
jgi:N6-adenosine-specific RNA methylase IME4